MRYESFGPVSNEDGTPSDVTKSMLQDTGRSLEPPFKPNEPRYWVYSHDKNGDLLENIADEEQLRHAVDAAASYLTRHYPADWVTVRIVDHNLQEQTVWMAGPPKDWVPEDV